jgi:hypothetical protein
MNTKMGGSQFSDEFDHYVTLLTVLYSAVQCSAHGSSGGSCLPASQKFPVYRPGGWSAGHIFGKYFITP